jgi:hypothetical protein
LVYQESVGRERGDYSDSSVAPSDAGSADKVTASIDGFFAFAESMVSGVGEILGAPSAARRARHQARSGASPTISPWHITEFVDGATGQKVWQVTDGRNKAECNSAELAQHVLGLLQGVRR